MKNVINVLVLAAITVLITGFVSAYQSTATAQVNRLCSGTSDTNCRDSEGRFRCWDGTTIAIAPGQSCPPNPSSSGSVGNQQLCASTDGVWTSGTATSGGTCACPTGVFSITTGCPDAAAEGEASIETDCNEPTLTSENCKIIAILVGGINFLSALAGMAIVASITIAGYQYMTAKDNSGQIEAAKKRITWALVALGIFIFMYAGLDFLVPGGVI